ncbi:MAG: alpha/beta fold hydrolase [Candidatus Latescibacteria bacterium]|nr:alpha/beta fold hydrolase [Candidatus Latescibacterota bacterium]
MADYATIRVNNRDISIWQTGTGQQPLLLLHTLRTQIEYAQRIVPFLADGFRIIVPDLPGHGRSSKELSSPYDAALFVDTTAALVDELDLNQLIVLGESIGGAIALCLGARRPDRLARVFAVNPHDSTGSFIGGTVGKMVSFGGRFSALPFKLESAALLRYIFAAGFADRDNLSKDFVEKLMVVPNRDRQFPAAMQSIMKHAPSWSSLADQVYPQLPDSLPAHVLYGDRDWSPAWAPEQNRRRLPSHVQFHTLANTGHFSFLDNPTAAADIVKAAVDT